MNTIKRKHILPSLLLVQIVLVKTLGLFPEFIENWYSNGLYLVIAKFSRTLLGGFWFSIGDIIYIALILFIIRWFWIKRKGFLKEWKNNLLTILSWISILYFLFHFLWGMNYYRVPLTEKLNIEKEYTEEELLLFTEKMITKTNEIHLKITNNDTISVVVPYADEEVFEKALEGFKTLPRKLKEFHYETKSIKPSLLRIPLSYMGFGGYLNPFTNEAQLNTLKPNFTLPMTTCHEMVHQLGIASETDCNFIGFIAATQNNDLYFQYSAYCFITRFCLGNLERIEAGKGKALLEKLNLGVQKNIFEHEVFWDSYHSPIDIFFELFYDGFLKANQQQDGMMSYSRFVGLIIGFERVDSNSFQSQ